LCELGRVNEQRLSKAPAAMPFIDKQIFQVDARLAQEGRVVVEEEREAHRLVAMVADDDLGVAALTEERFAQDVLGGRHFVRQLFINGELFYKAQNQRRVALDRRPDFKIFFRRHLIKKMSAAMVTKRITLTYAFVVKNAMFNRDISSARTSLCW